MPAPKTMIVTKLRIGDANTMMAEGGIQAADKPNDSPAIHFLDAFGGGHFAAKRELLAKLVCDAPEAIQWLNDLGVEFDKAPDGTMITTHGGGTSRKRMHAAKGLLRRRDHAHAARRSAEPRDPGGGFHRRHRADSGRAGQSGRCGADEYGNARADGRARQNGHHRDGRRGPDALPGLPDVQPLRRNGRRTGAGLPRRREAAVRRHAPISPDRRGVSAADFRRTGHGKSPFARREARQPRRQGLYASAGNPRRGGGLDHSGMQRPRRRRRHRQRPGRVAGHADDRANRRRRHHRSAASRR